ncbi:penicillin acylase family protein [Phaeobacter sp. QD34_3]|uniref:penicillin acylase family protein n=1 Tax=unclassified Phaeobacter TaxID=2621772 RepID=UPI00237F9B0A|nr:MULTISPECIES: penicillin acylase family protein [unclassified Phaeobacter]MDE4133259.1 penicillin acylase family protein [Phaeobacter sp. QD34_3]MDE4136954.1 penicillin acylase family protein [Phaeobacter sp. QD34_24]
MKDRLHLALLRHGEWILAAIGLATLVASGPVAAGLLACGLGLAVLGLWRSPAGRVQLLAYLAMRRRPLRRRNATIRAGVSAPVDVRFDIHALPTIRARTETDAWHAAGLVLASERLFQMDLARRRTSARLAELLGPLALDSDRKTVRLGLSAAAEAMLPRLSPLDRALLQAFSDGVNAYLTAPDAPLPFEYRVLACRPAPWTPADSLSILIGLHVALGEGPEAARMHQIMDQTLPAEIRRFLSGQDAKPPLAALSALLARQPAGAPAAPLTAPPAGAASNAAALPAGAMQDGKSALINDLHLPLTLPGALFMLQIELPDQQMTGALFPGVPVLVAGRSEQIAFGVTSLAAVTCRASARHGPATCHPVTLQQRGGAPQEAALWLDAGWPVPDGPEGRWRLQLDILRPDGIDLRLADVLGATSVSRALSHAAQAAAPPLELVVIDAQGRAGRGATRFTAAPQEVAKATANRPLVCANGPHPLSLSPSHPGRGERFKALLRADRPLTPETLEASARDLTLPVLEAWHGLSLEAAAQAGLSPSDQDLLRSWSKTADPGDRATAWITAFAEQARARVLGTYLWPCVAEDPGFILRLNDLDSPALAVIAARPDPVPGGQADWPTLLAEALTKARRALCARHGRHDPRWGAVNAPRPAHPLSPALPLLGAALRWPKGVSPGAEGAVWRTTPDTGIALRLMLHGGPSGPLHYLIPPGQSGWPLDPAAQSQIRAWRQGRALPMGRPGVGGGIRLIPAKDQD